MASGADNQPALHEGSLQHARPVANVTSEPIAVSIAVRNRQPLPLTPGFRWIEAKSRVFGEESPSRGSAGRR